MVTGGAGAIGGAIVARFLSDGARVAILDLRLEAGLAKVRELAAAGLVTEGRVTCHEVDVRSREKCREVVTQIVAAWGGVHHLVNCVAYFGSEGLQATEADWDTTMRWSWAPAQHWAVSSLRVQGERGGLLLHGAGGGGAHAGLQRHGELQRDQHEQHLRPPDPAQQVRAVKWTSRNFTVPRGGTY